MFRKCAQVASTTKRRQNRAKLKRSRRKKNELHEAKTENFMFNFYSCFIFVRFVRFFFFSSHRMERGLFAHDFGVFFLSSFVYNSLHFAMSSFLSLLCVLWFLIASHSLSRSFGGICAWIWITVCPAMNGILNLIMCAM